MLQQHGGEHRMTVLGQRPPSIRFCMSLNSAAKPTFAPAPCLRPDFAEDGRWCVTDSQLALFLRAPGPACGATARGSTASPHSEHVITLRKSCPQVTWRCSSGGPFFPA